MKRILLIAVMVLLFAMTFVQVGMYLQKKRQIDAHVLRMDGEVQRLETQLDALRAQMETELMVYHILDCESGMRHRNVWGKQGEYGIAQFKERTFYWLAEQAGMEGMDWQNRNDQIALLYWAVENGHASHWSCAR